MPLSHVRKASHACLAYKYVLGIDSVLKAKGSHFRFHQERKSAAAVSACRSRCTGSEYDGAASTAPRAPSHHRAAAAAVLPALAARALRVVAPAAMSGRGGGFGPKLPAERTWVPLSELLLFGSLLLWESPRVTRPRSAGQAIGASFSAIHCSASFSQLNIASSI